MAIRVTNENVVEGAMKEFRDGLNERIYMSFKRAGDDFKTAATDQPQGHELGYYNDETSNLRHSIGYYIFKDGELLFESDTRFPEANKTEIDSVIQKQGWQLIAIAGMGYASFVEAKGYNVISNQANAMIIDLTDYLENALKYKGDGDVQNN